jgi:hypothetical protein
MPDELEASMRFNVAGADKDTGEAIEMTVPD